MYNLFYLLILGWNMTDMLFVILWQNVIYINGYFYSKARKLLYGILKQLVDQITGKCYKKKNSSTRGGLQVWLKPWFGWHRCLIQTLWLFKSTWGQAAFWLHFAHSAFSHNSSSDSSPCLVEVCFLKHRWNEKPAACTLPKNSFSLILFHLFTLSGSY